MLTRSGLYKKDQEIHAARFRIPRSMAKRISARRPLRLRAINTATRHPERRSKNDRLVEGRLVAALRGPAVMKRLKNYPYKDAEVGLRTDFTDLSSPLHGSLPAGRLAQAGKGQGGLTTDQEHGFHEISSLLCMASCDFAGCFGGGGSGWADSGSGTRISRICPLPCQQPAAGGSAQRGRVRVGVINRAFRRAASFLMPASTVCH